jgi:hypothetical protein
MKTTNLTRIGQGWAVFWETPLRCLGFTLYKRKQPYRDPDLAPRELAPPPRAMMFCRGPTSS